ncbi:hypothetical protein ACJX0J_040214 [Zea mays]
MLITHHHHHLRREENIPIHKKEEEEYLESKERSGVNHHGGFYKTYKYKKIKKSYNLGLSEIFFVYHFKSSGNGITNNITNERYIETEIRKTRAIYSFKFEIAVFIFLAVFGANRAVFGVFYRKRMIGFQKN